MRWARPRCSSASSKGSSEQRDLLPGPGPLANGVSIPKLGLGTWFIDDDKAADVVGAAIEIGYRNIDTAQAYGNERGVGDGVRGSGAAREALFVSTKLAAEIKDYDRAVAAIEGSLNTMGLDYLDLMLIHAPQPWDDFRGGDYSAGNLAAMAERYGVSVPQLCIRYTIQLGTVSLPKTANPDHLRTNADLDFVIDEEDMQALRGLDDKDYGEHAVFPVYSGR